MQINKTNLRTNRSLKWGNDPNKIILHHPEYHGDIQGLNEIMINDGFSMIGYNYYVRKDGTVWEGRPVEAIGGNCYGHNATSIGIAFEGNFMTDTMSNEQFNSGVGLCRYLMQRYGIEEIGPHSKYYNTDCPGVNFPVSRMIAEIEGSSSVEMASNQSYSSDDWVSRLQQECNNQGFSSQVVDGIPGNNTLNGCPTLREGAQGNITRLLQEKLNSLGYSTNGVDGIFGNGTYNAVYNFQCSHELDADGIVGQNTWRKILGI